MQPFTTLTSTALPLRTENVDTDQIIPARYLTAVTQEGMGDGLFSWWRYTRNGSPNPDFVLNQPQYQGSEILVAGRNFGIGSSREHAVWALTQYGFRAVISPTFADIFYNNSLKNGLLPIRLPEETVSQLLDLVEEVPQTSISIDLSSQTLKLPDLDGGSAGPSGGSWSFEIDPFRKQCLLRGLDDLGYILDKEEQISAFEAAASL
jgi:3-isopropylmalate/(R)-2-methylmalate dehydratase small subunit